MNTIKRTIAVWAVMAMAGAARLAAAPVDAETAKTAAANFIRHDSAGALLLAGRTVKSAEAHGALWMVRLAPAGYIVVAQDDAAEPVVAFSPNGDGAADPASPFAVMLDTESDNVYRAIAGDTVGSVSLMSAFAAVPASSGRRAAKWALLKTGVRAAIAAPMSFVSGYAPDGSQVMQSPLLPTAWSQWQPYNDLSPVWSQQVGSYRGRVPCGCVATMYAQILNYWKWPVRPGSAVRHTHNVTGGAYSSLTLEIDGDVAFDYTKMQSGYRNYDNGYDLRGKVAEAVRYPVARLILWADVLANMQFGKDGSAAALSTPAWNSWYESGAYISRSTMAAEGFAQLRNSIVQSRRPVLVGVPGHAIVADGWAESGDGTAYVHLNYGWGGSDDGYYTVVTEQSQNANSGYITDAIVDHRPKNTAALAPLPNVSESSFTVSWTVPPCYETAASGFAVKVSGFKDEPETFTDDFTSQLGVSSNPDRICIVNNGFNVSGNATASLRFRNLAFGTYAYSRPIKLTSASRLTYRIYSGYALDQSLDLQMRIPGGEWQTLDKPTLKQEEFGAGWESRSVFIGQYGSETVYLRWNMTRTGSRFYNDADYPRMGVFVDDLTVESALVTAVQEYSAPGTARSLALAGLQGGKEYSITVTPADGVESAPALTRIAGTSRDPLPGTAALTYAATNYTFTAGDPSWNVQSQYTADGDSVWLGKFSGELSVAVPRLTAQSTFSFECRNQGSYSSGTDAVTIKFVSSSGQERVLGNLEFKSANMTWRPYSYSLGSLAGTGGKISIDFKHSGAQTSGGGINLRAVSLTGAQVEVIPEVLWGPEQHYATAPSPSVNTIASLNPGAAAVTEGFYRECARGTNVLLVSCSPQTVRLEARPSHRSLVREADVAAYALGNGQFAVTIDGSNIPAGADRTRMLLALRGYNANGDVAVKEMVLRFSDETHAEPGYEPPPEPQTTSGTAATMGVKVPYSWLVDQGLATADFGEASMEAAAQADSDGDGFPNYQEYICGTDPNDAESKFQVYIELVDGEPVITWSATNAPLATYTVQGRAALDNTAQWTEKTPANTPQLRFFRVKITPRQP